MMKKSYYHRYLRRDGRSKVLPKIIAAGFLFFLMLPVFGQSWELNPANFELSMNITAKVKLDGQFINQENSQLAAFVGDELRGVVEPIYSGASNTLYYFLTVYSNQAEGEMISFKFRDEAELETELLNQVAFFVDKILGKTTDPFIVMNSLEYASTDFLAFSIPNQIINSQIDEYSKSIYVSMPEASDLTQLIPNFKLPVGANAYVNDELQESEVNSHNFSTPNIYRVVGVDNASVDWTIFVSNELYFTLTYLAGSGGTLNGETNQEVYLGEDGTAVEATPDNGYHFVMWSDESTENPRMDQNVTSDISVTAEFAVGAYSLTYFAGEGGALSGETSQEVQHGEDGTAVEAIPDLGYHFVKWSDELTENPRTDLNVASVISVTAEFAINMYSLLYQSGAGGTLSGEMNQEVYYSEDGTAVEAIPDAGYYFLKWSDDVTENPRIDLNITSDLSVTAEFVINTFSLVYLAGTGGSLSGDLEQEVNYNENGTAIEAIPDAGYHFVMWSDESTENPRMDQNVTSDISVTAEFAEGAYSLTYFAGEGGALSGETSQEVQHGEDGTAVEAIPDVGYHFVKWSDESTENPRADLNVTSNISVTAEFALGAYSLEYLADVGGTISGETNQSVFHGEDGTAVEAIPDFGYYFTKWSDESTENPRTDLNVTSNISVSAEFVKNTYLLNYSTGGNGILIGELEQSVDYGEDGTSIEAVPDDVYHFVKWSDGSTDNPRMDLNVSSDISVTAEFAQGGYILTYRAGFGGSLIGEIDQEIIYKDDGRAVKAIPDAGYYFVQWSDGLKDEMRTDLNIIADISVIAEFELIPGLIDSFNSEISIYPNPVEEVLFIDLGLTLSEVKLRLIHMSGKIIQEQTYLNQQVLELSIKQAPGIYLIVLEAENLRITKRIIRK